MIRIAVVDDHPLVRAGLRVFLDEQDGLAVVAEAASGDEVVALVRRGGLDVVLLDIAMPRCNGVEAIGLIRARAPQLAVIVFSGHPAARYGPTMRRLGADDYLDKGGDPQEIVATIRRVCEARSRRTAADALAQASSAPALAGHDAPHDQLDKREFQIFLRLAQGQTNAVIGAALSLSAATVSVHRTRLSRKLCIRTNSGLTRYAVQHGLL